jgi:hypothetical protein
MAPAVLILFSFPTGYLATGYLAVFSRHLISTLVVFLSCRIRDKNIYFDDSHYYIDMRALKMNHYPPQRGRFESPIK